MERFEEQYQCVQGEMRYFALYATDQGVLEAIITRSEDNKAVNKYEQKVGSGNTDYRAQAFVFQPEGDKMWPFIAALLYSECEGRDVPMHGDPTPHLDGLRADADKVIHRAVAVLTAYNGCLGDAVKAALPTLDAIRGTR